MTSCEALKKYFGFDNFRGGQSEIISAISSGRDVLGVMPTGAGKSVCFQLPAITHDGLTLVISPLISLMKDQVGALGQSGIPAAYINSTLTPRQMELATENARYGRYKLIYVAPERLTSPDFIDFAQNVNIFMVAVDEAHCISQWGQDFRPSYSQIPQFIDQLATRPIVSAFTATATRRVREDIVELLGLRDPLKLVTGFDRQNLYFEVRSPRDKFGELLSFLQTQPGRAGIVYCSTRKNVEEVCDRLNQAGISALRYHAGLSDGERHKNQDDFLYDRALVMVATNAFGMGIDKSNVSFVVHYNMPKDIESYYQEAGRAGRDGSSAVCLLLYSGQDVMINKWMINNNSDSESVDPETARLLREGEHRRLREMADYCTSGDCLRSFILRYFGEDPPDFCGNCGNCDSDAETADVTTDARMILSCVARMRGAYGAALVCDVLRGKNSVRLTALGFDKLSTFGINNRDARELRAVIYFLVRRGYLSQDEGEFPVLRLTPTSQEALSGAVKLEMKLPAPREHKAERSRSKNTQTEHPALFERLKALRRELADKQSVPAFVIFTDATLVEISNLMPITPDEFLRVSGVGNEKLKRYGERFMGEIAAYRASGEAEAVKPPPAAPSPEDVKISSEPIKISEFTAAINELSGERGIAKISAHKLSEWLVESGYLSQQDGGYKIPTDKGLALGIAAENRTSKNGDYILNLYNSDAQRFILSHISEIAAFVIKK